MNVIQSIRKALVPAVVALVLAVLAHYNVTADMNVQQVIVLLVTSVIVYFVPNEPPTA